MSPPKGLFGTAYNRILDGEKRADEKIPPNARRFSRFCQTQRQQNAKFVLRPVKSGKRLLARFSVPRVPSKRVSWTRKQTGPYSGIGLAGDAAAGRAAGI